MNKRFKILAVDDDPANIQIVTSALMDEYDVITALCGHDAISQIKEHVPDLILLDVMMPDLSGFEVCSIIKTDAVYADIPVIFLTALDTLDGEMRGLEIGGIDYLAKPINFTLLKLRVRNHLELRERNELLKEQRYLLARQKEELAQMVADLELQNKQLRETEEALQQTLGDARNTNSKMIRLLRTVAHEFRTPLGLLTGSTDILDRYWDRMTIEKRSEQNENIRSAARQLSNLLNSVILFTQTGVEMPMKPPRLLDIENNCRSIAAEIVTFWGSGHKFNVTIAADCGTALLDGILFRRVLENLLTNAFRYTPSGGDVSLRVWREKNRLWLEISDTGIGIPEEDQKLIFDAFYRCRNVEEQRGLGLGLSIVQEALSDMSGAITVKSGIGEGTTMRVEIPLCIQS